MPRGPSISAVPKVFQIALLKAEVVTDLVEQCDHDFAVDGVVDIVVGLVRARLPTPGRVDDPGPKKANVRRENSGLVDAALGQRNS